MTINSTTLALGTRVGSTDNFQEQAAETTMFSTAWKDNKAYRDQQEKVNAGHQSCSSLVQHDNVEVGLDLGADGFNMLLNAGSVANERD